MNGIGPVVMFRRMIRPKPSMPRRRYTGKRLFDREKRQYPEKNSIPNLAFVTSWLGVAAPNLPEVSSWVGDDGPAIGTSNPHRSFEEALQPYGQNRVLAPSLRGRNIASRREAVQSA